MGNLDIWDKFSMPPEWALRRISGGRLNGKTDINPQWRMRAMTEAFGPCGIGWKYTIDKLWAEPGADGQVMAMALVSVSWRDEGLWSDPIQGIGGSMLVEKEKGGLHTSDEGYKMAVTDALSVAFKALGVAADIYQGDAWQSKYMRESAPPEKIKFKDSGTPMPKAMNIELMQLYESMGFTREERIADADRFFKSANENYEDITTFKQLTPTTGKALLDHIKGAK